MLERAFDVVFPPRCAGCGEGAWPFCSPCSARLRVLEPPWCDRCGAPARSHRPSCEQCPPSAIAWARAPFAFDGPARAAVHHLKYRGVRGVGRALGAAMATCLPRGLGVDVVTWVPLARRRRAERGFDQAKLLATAVGAEAGLPVRRLLRRTVATRPQAKRDASARRDAMRGSFVTVGRVEPHGHVLLIDDVLTTGATASACAETLLANGSVRVSTLVAARTLLRDGGPAYTRAGPRPGLWLPGDHLR